MKKKNSRPEKKRGEQGCWDGTETERGGGGREPVWGGGFTLKKKSPLRNAGSPTSERGKPKMQKEGGVLRGLCEGGERKESNMKGGK